jgi:hypothetical protein
VPSNDVRADCLHWGWLRGDVYLNPLDLVGHERVRLLPLFSVPAVGDAEGFRLALPYAGWHPLLTLVRSAETRTTRARSP